MPNLMETVTAIDTVLREDRKKPASKPGSGWLGAWLFLLVGLAVLLYGVAAEILNLPQDVYAETEMHLIEKEVGVYDEERGVLDYRLKYEYWVDGKPYYYIKVSNTTQREVNAPQTYLIYYNVNNPNERRYVDNPTEFRLQYGSEMIVGTILTGLSLILLFIIRPRREKTPKPPKRRIPKEKKPRRNRNDDDGFFANDTF